MIQQSNLSRIRVFDRAQKIICCALLIFGLVLAELGFAQRAFFLNENVSGYLRTDTELISGTKNGLYVSSPNQFTYVGTPTPRDLDLTVGAWANSSSFASDRPVGTYGRFSRLEAGRYLTAASGWLRIGSPLQTSQRKIGHSKLIYNVAGRYSVEGGPVDVRFQGDLDGRLRFGYTRYIPCLYTTTPAPTANVRLAINVPGVGTASQSENITTFEAKSFSLMGQVSIDGGAGVRGGIIGTNQLVQSRPGLLPFYFLYQRAPHGVYDINFAASFEASSQSGYCGFYNADAGLSRQFVILTPVVPPAQPRQPIKAGMHHIAKNNFTLNDSDAYAFEGNMLTASFYDSGSETLSLQGRIINDDAEVSAISDDDPIAPSESAMEYQGDIKMDWIFDSEQYAVPPEIDKLSQAVVTFDKPFVLVERFENGVIRFDDVSIKLLDPLTKKVLAEALLTNLLADPLNGAFLGEIENFQLISIGSSHSPLGATLSQHGGVFTMDGSLISATEGFTKSAEQSYYFIRLLPNLRVLKNIN